MNKMKPYDRLKQCEVLIRQFEYRHYRDDFDHLLLISKDVIGAFHEAGEDYNSSLIRGRLKETEFFAGTHSRDQKTLSAFDDYKHFLLEEIKAAKVQLGEADD